MPELPHEAHPRFDITCAGCKHWLNHKAEKVAIIQQPNGQTMGVPYDDARNQAMQQGQGAGFLANQIYTVASDCTLNPTWSKVSANHWCSHYEGRVKQ